MRNAPYTIAFFDWSNVELRLKFVGTSIDGRPQPTSLMCNPDHAARWSSPQAARQYLERVRQKHHLGDEWEVLDLRRVNAPVRRINPGEVSKPATTIESSAGRKVS